MSAEPTTRTESFEDINGRPFFRRITPADRMGSYYAVRVRCPTCGWQLDAGQRSGRPRAVDLSEIVTDAHLC
jgi:hypothetical protein